MLIARDLIENCTSFNKKMRIEMLEKFPLPFLSFEEEIIPHIGIPAALLLLDDLQGVYEDMRLMDLKIQLGRNFLQRIDTDKIPLSEILRVWVHSPRSFRSEDMVKMEYSIMKERRTLEDPEEICLYNAILSVLRGRPGNAYIMLLLREHMLNEQEGFFALKVSFGVEMFEWLKTVGRVI